MLKPTIYTLQHGLSRHSSPDILLSAQNDLDAAWELWQPLVDPANKDDDLFKCEMFTAETESQFAAISKRHADIVNLYWEWTNVVMEASEALLPKKLSLFDVACSSQIKEASIPPADINERSGEDEESLWQKLETISAPRSRKRKNRDNDEAVEDVEDEVIEDNDIYSNSSCLSRR